MSFDCYCGFFSLHSLLSGYHNFSLCVRFGCGLTVFFVCVCFSTHIFLFSCHLSGVFFSATFHGLRRMERKQNAQTRSNNLIFLFVGASISVSALNIDNSWLGSEKNIKTFCEMLCIQKEFIILLLFCNIIHVENVGMRACPSGPARPHSFVRLWFSIVLKIRVACDIRCVG